MPDTVRVPNGVCNGPRDPATTSSPAGADGWDSGCRRPEVFGSEKPRAHAEPCFPRAQPASEILRRAPGGVGGESGVSLSRARQGDVCASTKDVVEGATDRVARSKGELLLLYTLNYNNTTQMSLLRTSATRSLLRSNTAMLGGLRGYAGGPGGSDSGATANATSFKNREQVSQRSRISIQSCVDDVRPDTANHRYTAE